MPRKALFATCFLFALAACGTTEVDRTLSGTGIGASAGLATALLIDGNPVTAVLVGGAAGAAAGAFTKPDDIYLGAPVWENMHY